MLSLPGPLRDPVKPLARGISPRHRKLRLKRPQVSLPGLPDEKARFTITFFARGHRIRRLFTAVGLRSNAESAALDLFFPSRGVSCAACAPRRALLGHTERRVVIPGWLERAKIRSRARCLVREETGSVTGAFIALLLGTRRAVAWASRKIRSARLRGNTFRWVPGSGRPPDRPPRGSGSTGTIKDRD
jgi:hypothetical protein